MADGSSTAEARPTIYVVDDDDAGRTATARLLSAAGFDVRTYANPLEFAAIGDITAPACLVLDLRMPGLSGLELQERLNAWRDPPPIVFLSGHGQVADSVQAMRHGAVDFLTKPIGAAQLLDAVARALTRDRDERVRRKHLRELRARYERLTAREREVLPELLAGRLNKQIAFELGTAERTIKVHRARILRKMEAASIADLVRMADTLGIKPVAASE